MQQMGQAELDALHEDYISDILQLHLQRVQKLTEMGKKRRKLLVPAEDEGRTLSHVILGYCNAHLIMLCSALLIQKAN